MGTFRMEGFGRINGGEYDNINIEGISSCSDNIKAENIHIQGVFTCSGEINAITMYCEGVSDFKSNIRAKKLTVEGVCNVKEGTKIEAEELICNGVIRTNGEIYADVLKSDGCISAREVYGDEITIDTHDSVNRIKRFFNSIKSDIRLIEATKVDLRGVIVETINARDIIIGPYCTVKNVDCSGTLSIDSTSTVGNLTGEYTRRN